MAPVPDRPAEDPLAALREHVRHAHAAAERLAFDAVGPIGDAGARPGGRVRPGGAAGGTGGRRRRPGGGGARAAGGSRAAQESRPAGRRRSGRWRR